MIINDIEKVYQTANSIDDDHFSNEDGFLMNLFLYKVMKSKYLKKDFEGMIIKFDEKSGLAWISKNTKLISEMPGISISMRDVIDISCSSWDSNWKEIKDSSKVVLNEGQEKSLRDFINSSKSLNIEDFIKSAIQNNLLEVIKALSDTQHSISIESHIENMNDILSEKDELKTKELIDSINFDEISRYTVEDLMASKEKELSDLSEYLRVYNKKYNQLDVSPEDCDIEIKVLKINSLDDFEYARELIEKLDFGSIKDNTFNNNVEKGLVYSKPIEPDDDLIVLATNGLELVGYSTIKDLNKESQGKDPRLHLNSICTQDKFRNMGVATKIFEKIISNAKEENLFISRSLPSNDGKLKTYNKFTKIAEKNNVMAIPKKDVNSYKYFIQKLSKQSLTNSELILKYKDFKKSVIDKNISDYDKIDKLFFNKKSKPRVSI